MRSKIVTVISRASALLRPVRFMIPVHFADGIEIVYSAIRSQTFRHRTIKMEISLRLRRVAEIAWAISWPTVTVYNIYRYFINIRKQTSKFMCYTYHFI